MRLLFLSLAILFFEKNAVAVVRGSATSSVQLVENQSVKLSERLSKTDGPHFFVEKKGLAFFKKRNHAKLANPVADGYNSKRTSRLMGLFAFVLMAPAISLFGAGLGAAGLLCLGLMLLCGIFAFPKGSRKRFVAGMALLVASSLTVVLSILAIALSGCD